MCEESVLECMLLCLSAGVLFSMWWYELVRVRCSLSEEMHDDLY